MAQLQDQITELNKGFSTAFINQANHSSLGYRPEFIFNNYHQGKRYWCQLKKNWQNVMSFASVWHLSQRAGSRRC